MNVGIVTLLVSMSFLATASCVTTKQSENPSNDYAVAVSAIGLPAQIEGEIDTAWEYYAQLAAECSQPAELCQLYRYVSADAYVGSILVKNIGRKMSDLEVNGLNNGETLDALRTIEVTHSEWLEDTIRGIGWFKISVFGSDADAAAFLILQHSSNILFQKETLEMLIELSANGDSDPGDVAMLSDRIAIKSDEAQRFGTQGYCLESGDWTPFPVSDVINVDEERAKMGLTHLDEYVSQMSVKFCK